MQVFVYGSLRQGGYYHGLIAPFTQAVETGWLDGMALFQVNERYPGIVRGEGHVLGELITLDPDRLTLAMGALDELEEYFGPGDPRNLYERELLTVRTVGGALVQAWAYRWLGSAEGCTRIADGDWIRYWREHSVPGAVEGGAQN
jgi:gamma-glutamylcyclotransferase (GGCT)/AIG2-like uncharacterized protein YtfP